MLEAGIGCFNQKYLKAFKCVALVGPDRKAHTFQIILYFSRDLGKKMYELSNHLGNVLTTVSDIKLTADANTDGVVDSYAAVITSAQDYYTKLKLQLVQRRTAISYLDNAVETCCSALQFGLKYKSTRYYPFGSLETGRTYSSDNYRFGFNGKENDNEVKGTGNSVDFGARIYDSRLGQFISIDPLYQSYPNQSPYCAFNGNPNLFADPSGKGGIITIDKETKKATLTFNLNLYGEEGMTQEQVISLVTQAFPGADAFGSTSYSVPVSGKWTYNGVEYDLEVNVNISVMNRAEVHTKMKEAGDDISQNFYEVRNNATTEGGRNKDASNVGFFDSGAFLSGEKIAKNIIIEEMWHGAGAVYSGKESENAGNECFGNHSDNIHSVCAGKFDNADKMVQAADTKIFPGNEVILLSDMEAIERGAGMIKPQGRGAGLQLDFHDGKAYVGKKASAPVDNTFKHSNSGGKE